MSLEENNTDEFVRTIVNATISMILAKGKDKKGMCADLAINFIAQFMGVLIYQALTIDHPPGMTSQEKYERTKKNYENMKLAIQEAVSVAFKSAMISFSKKDIEYYCLIKTVPEQKSRLFN